MYKHTFYLSFAAFIFLPTCHVFFFRTSHTSSCRISTHIFFQVWRWLLLLLRWFFNNHKIFDKHALIDRLKALFLIINIIHACCHKETFYASWCLLLHDTHSQKHHFALWLLASHYSFKAYWSSMSWSPFSIALSFTTSCMPTFLSCIHSFILFQSFLPSFSILVCLLNKTYSLSMITFPCFRRHADTHRLPMSSFHL